MKIPKYIIVKGKKYKIVFGNLNESTAAECDKDHKIIYLRKDRDKYLVEDLAHELMHAICREVAIDQVISPSMEQILAENVAQVFNDIFLKKIK